jgi:acid stress-induced BolA-like protein IbaG/YrbA
MRKIDLQEVLTRRLRLSKPRFKLENFAGKLAGSIISNTFLGKGDSDRQDMIWDALEAEFGPHAVRQFGTLLAYTDAEWDMDFIDLTRRPLRRFLPGPGEIASAAYETLEIREIRGNPGQSPNISPHSPQLMGGCPQFPQFPENLL